MFNPIRVYFLEKKIIEIENNFKTKFFLRRIEKKYTFMELFKIILENLPKRKDEIYLELNNQLENKILNISIPNFILDDFINMSIEKIFNRYNFKDNILNIKLLDLIDLYLFELNIFKEKENDKLKKYSIDRIWAEEHKTRLNNFIFKLSSFFLNQIEMIIFNKFYFGSNKTELAYSNFKKLETISFFLNSNNYSELLEIINKNDKQTIFRYIYRLIRKNELNFLFKNFYGSEQKELELLFIEEYIFDYLIRNSDSGEYFIKDNDNKFLYLYNLKFLLFSIQENFNFIETKNYICDIKKLYIKFLIELEKNGYSKLPDYYIFRSISNNYKIV